MKDAVLQVPVALLTDPVLPASAKLLWMAARLAPAGAQPGTSRLSETTGLSHPTVRKAVAQLSAAGWAPSAGEPPGATVPMPVELLIDSRLGILTRLLYGLLPLVPGFSHSAGQVSCAALAELAHSGTRAVSRALAELEEAQWITVQQKNRQAPIAFTVTSPALVRGLNDIAQAQARLADAEHRGEGLMKEYLLLLVDSSGFVENARPGFLLNRGTEKPLELDRYFPAHKVAFEYQGPQHFRKTKRFSAAEVAAQRERDIWKAGLCTLHGTTLISVVAEDLTLERMRQKVEGRLPLRDLTGKGLLIEFLEHESRDYRRLMAHI